jgi:ABC-2 type transport system permease protein
MELNRNWHTIKAIFLRELTGYFGSAIAYVFIVIFLVLCGFFTFSISNFYDAGQADLRSFFEWHPWIFLFLVPAVAMRLWADERKSGTLEILLTLPVTLTEAVLAKFLAAWVFIGVALCLTFPMPLTAMYLGGPDAGAMVSGYLGSLFLGGAYLAVGSMTSALTKNQVISFVLSVVICLFLVLVGWPPVTNFLTGWAPSWLIATVEGFSIWSHFVSMQRGVLDLRDLVYYLSLIFFALYGTGVIIETRKSA